MVWGPRRKIPIILRHLKSAVNVIFVGLLRMRSRDAFRVSQQKHDSPASSDDELEAETSFSTFKPKEGFVNPLHEGPSTFQPPVASGVIEAVPVEGSSDVMETGQRGLAKSR